MDTKLQTIQIATKRALYFCKDIEISNLDNNNCGLKIPILNYAYIIKKTEDAIDTCYMTKTIPDEYNNFLNLMEYEGLSDLAYRGDNLNEEEILVSKLSNIITLNYRVIIDSLYMIAKSTNNYIDTHLIENDNDAKKCMAYYLELQYKYFDPCKLSN